MEKSPHDPGGLRSQSSFEYLMIVALTFALIIPTSYLFYHYSKESSLTITDSQITKIGRGIIDTSESIYYSGIGSKTTLELNVPHDVTSAMIIDGRELVFNVTNNFGVSEIVFFSRINLTTAAANCIGRTCSIPELSSTGLKKIKIESVSKNSVSIGQA